jgi:hypothetical protein
MGRPTASLREPRPRDNGEYNGPKSLVFSVAPFAGNSKPFNLFIIGDNREKAREWEVTANDWDLATRRLQPGMELIPRFYVD